MFTQNTIRSLLAVVMLGLFSFSITPKRFLHDVFATHTELVSVNNHDGAACVSQAGFTCDCLTLVATSPFTEYTDVLFTSKITAFAERPVYFPSRIIAVTQFFFEQRGPPVLG